MHLVVLAGKRTHQQDGLPGQRIDLAGHLNVGDIVLCKVNGFQYLHLIKVIQGKRFQIGNNRGRMNGWIGENGIHGKCIRIE